MSLKRRKKRRRGKKGKILNKGLFQKIKNLCIVPRAKKTNAGALQRCLQKFNFLFH
jgi:hypothetical protein